MPQGATGLRGIVDSGEIRITGKRYENSLCRHLKCVSLFDFGATAVDDWGQFRNWRGWFGYQQDERVAIWLEIDRQATTDNVYDAGTLHQLSKNFLAKRFIPGVEAGHRGPVPHNVLSAVLLIDRHDLAFFERHDVIDERLIDHVAKFGKSLPPPPKPSPLVAILEAAREREFHQRQQNP